MTIENGSKVSIHYTLTNNEGNVLDSSSGRDPLSYTAGAGEIIPGLDKALIGKQAGDRLTVKVAAEDAYGHRVEEAIQVIPKSDLAHLPDIEEGMPLHAETADGNVVSFIITEIGEETVTLDGNHPLAGIELNFEVEIASVESASRIIVDH